jgi:peptidoglycan/xylan/chitin deacetylase (PgdA/CDA1 family)/ketosteroid isomerase-like protein
MTNTTPLCALCLLSSSALAKNMNRLLPAVAAAGLALAGLTVATPAEGQTFEVAVTIDDLPWSGPASRDDLVRIANHQILGALEARNVPAVGFVVCDAIGANGDVVHDWLERGHRLGNHTASHLDLNNTVPMDWIADAERCHGSLADITDPAFFRYPMLHRGSTADTRTVVAAAVHRLGYQVAPVTIDDSEWVIASQYRAAAQRDHSAAMRRLGAQYVSHLRRATEHARVIARARFGREVKHVLLVHVNQLNADWLGPALDSLRADGARFIGLDEALADSIYSLPDDYAGEKGLSWSYRVEPSQPTLALWDEEEVRELRTVPLAEGVDPDVLRQIAERSREFSATYLGRDPAGVGEFYTEDAVLVLPGGRVVAGREGIERYWTLGPRVRALEHRLRTERLYGDADRVVEVGRWFSTSQRDGAEPASAAGRYVVEWVCGQDGRWLMRVDTWHRDDGEER